MSISRKIPNKDTYSQFLISTFGRYSVSWLARLLDNKPAHDSWNRWLSQTKLKPNILWEDIQHLVDFNDGYLIVDDSVIDKWYAEQIELTKWQYSGTHHRVVKGINVVSLLWTKHLELEKAEHYIIDFRIYAPLYDGKSKHDHCREMLKSAFSRGFKSPTVVIDSWYQDTKTLKFIDKMGWKFVVGLKNNRQVHFDQDEPYRSVAEVAPLEEAKKYWMKQFGYIKLLKIVRPSDDNIEYVATNNLSLSAPDIRNANACRWRIEEYHRGTKQLTGLEQCQFRNQRAQRNHILCSIRALIALEQWRLERGIPWYEAKQQLIVEAISNYLKNPSIPLLRASAYWC